MTKQYFLILVFFLLLQQVHAQSLRTVINFNNGWKFSLGNDSAAKDRAYNDAKWRTLNLPHDWSIESNFIKEAPATNQGGSLPGGIGWYRKSFTVPASVKDKVVTIEFDGVYKNSEVWINGKYLGKRPYGYINFSYEITKHVLPGKTNMLVVKVDNSRQPDSRWYTGSGIYRDVKLVIKNQLYIDETYSYIAAGLFAREKGNTFPVNWKKWKPGPVYVALHTSFGAINNNTNEKQQITYDYAVYDKAGRLVYKSDINKKELQKGEGSIIRFENLDGTHFKDPVLWSVDDPYLYKAVFRIYQDDKIIDEVSKTFGIRQIDFDSEKGFLLNDLPLKIHGVCMHHDLGALGAAFNKEAARRQLTILKEMGCNAIRFSHNPPAAAMLDLCDEMGFLVIDEAFDMWKKKKNKFDYHIDFAEWHQQDLEAMVYRDRQHPSIIAWSIGNEIREQFDSSGTILTRQLVDIVKRIDPTRPVITALTETMPEKNFISKASALDILGFNYKAYDYAALPQRFPGQKFIATETASALETRGVYQFPSDSIRIWPPDYKAQDTFVGNKDFTASAYDNTHAYWGGTHEQTWLAVKKYQHMAGIFVWSGFDFLGEPMPYPKFPSRSSYYGIVDLAGFPKDVYYMYQSEWSKKDVLHIFPHWTWTKQDTVDVWAYYNHADEVELYLNGRSVGKRTKTDTSLHVMWRLPFEAGTLKAISRKAGKTVLVKEIKTAGKPFAIQLSAHKKEVKAGGTGLLFVTAKIVDVEGNLVPDAADHIQFAVSGNATIAGTDNGYQADTVSLTNTKRRAWKGMALCIVKSSAKKGNNTLTATAPGLKTGRIAFRIVD